MESNLDSEYSQSCALNAYTEETTITMKKTMKIHDLSINLKKKQKEEQMSLQKLNKWKIMNQENRENLKQPKE